MTWQNTQVAQTAKRPAEESLPVSRAMALNWTEAVDLFIR